MQATEAMGRASYEQRYDTLLGDPVEWHRLDNGVKDRVMRSVQAVLDLAEKADRDPPMDFFDAWVDSFTIEPQSGGGSHINMKVVVPSSSRYHRQPGSTSRSVLSVMSGVANKMNQLRLSVVSDEKAKTDFGRMEKDGSLRDFAPGEGTW